MDVFITSNTEKKGVEIEFSARPQTEITNWLGSIGFNYHAKQKMWWAKNDQSISKIKVVNAFKKKAWENHDQCEQSLLYGLDQLPGKYKTTTLGKTNSDIYATVNKFILDNIEKNLTGGDQSWSEIPYVDPANYNTPKKAYKGINLLLLGAIAKQMGYKTTYYLTPSEIRKQGGKIKKGARIFPVVFYSMLFKVGDKFVSQDVWRNSDVEDKKNFPMLADIEVYNTEDVEGIDFVYPTPPIIYSDNQKIDVAEQIIKGYPKPPKLVWGGNRAFYRSGNSDLVTMPKLAQFNTSEDYYSVFFHELAHSTGSPKRLNRDMGNKFGSSKYAFEEVIAETASNYLMSVAQLSIPERTHSVNYIKGWLRAVKLALKDNKSILIKAFTQSAKAADHILNGKTYTPKANKKVAKPKQSQKIDQNGQMALFGVHNPIHVKTELRKNTPKKILIRKINEYYKVFEGSSVWCETLKSWIDIDKDGKGKIFSVNKSLENVAIYKHLDELILDARILEEFSPKTTGNQKKKGYKGGYNLVNYVKINSSSKVYPVKITLMKKANSKKFYLAHLTTDEKVKDIKKENQAPESNQNENLTNVLCPPTSNIRKSDKKGIMSSTPFMTAFERLNAPKIVNELYNLESRDLSKFLGDIEIKPKQSLAITLDSPEGGGKTHTMFQWAHLFAQSGYKPIIWTLEEHCDSELSKDKQRNYFDDKTNKIIAIESDDSDLTAQENYDKIIESIAYFDVVMIDSWAKLTELNSRANFDKDFRKAFNGKLFFVIFQRTSDGSMRGGSKGAFDGDVILKVDVDRDDFRNNFIYNHKNRYNSFMPISALQWSPYKKGLIPIKNKE